MNDYNYDAPVFDPDGEVEALYRAITGREAFSYNAAADPLYRSYADRYVQNGRMAMRDTVGRGAALTGGYGSSYAQSAGQQQYDAYLLRLSEALPELYGLAYQRYADQGRQMLDEYRLAYDRAGDDYARAYQQNRDAIADRRYADEQAAAAAQSAYKQQQTAYTNLVKLIQSSGYSPTDAELRAAGLTRQSAEALRQEYLRAKGLLATASSSSGGGGRAKASADEQAAAAAAAVGRQLMDPARMVSKAGASSNTSGSSAGGAKRTLMTR